MKKIDTNGFMIFLLVVLLWGCSDTEMFPPPAGEPADSVQLYRETFAEPQRCVNCHPQHVAEWETSTHAYAFTDPIFFTLNDMVQTEGLGQFCVKCHSPFGVLLEETQPGFDQADLSELARQAIHCDACHTVDTRTIVRGQGIQKFHLDQVRRGPIPDPQSNTFHESEFDITFTKSTFCASCHDVLSPDGSLMLEQTSTEWDNSPYQAMGLECQGCHMPTYSGQAAVNGPQRDNLHRHRFVGVDYPLIDFPGRQETIDAVRELLENAVSLSIEAPGQVSPGETFAVRVRVSNDQTGHDIPTGTIFERQMWIEIIVEDAQGQPVLASGLLDGQGDLRNHHSDEVNNGTVEEDTLLTLFHGVPFDANGDETLFFWKAASIQRNTIAPFQTRLVNYPLQAPEQATTLTVTTRLRFRSFPPYLLRALGKDPLIPSLIIFDMENAQATIAVSN